jgi:class 3 adenylate cyclase/tetratricopeptide (TPR) repeat protein
MSTCPNCGKRNPPGFTYCGFCGRPLAPPVLVGDERKVVTVLFCDLAGFTARADRADPEDVRAITRPYHNRMKQVIERFGGTVEKFIGDAVMAVFGAPIAHEDDPERAVRAGLSILGAISALNEERVGRDFRVRVGIETGEAVVDLEARPETGEGIAAGDVVNTASRLQTVAPIGGVAVGEGTFAATKDVFEYVLLEPVALKGKAEPVPIFHALSARGRFGIDLTRSFSSPLVGREVDRGLLKGTLDQAFQDHSVQLVTIVGEPGVGKSRLVADLLFQIEDGPELIRWRQGRCLPYGEGITFWALGEILKAEAGILETDPPDAADSKIEAVIPDAHPDAPWLRQRLRPLVGLDAPSADRDENFAAWRTFLETLAEARPSIFVFEDVHWADEALLAFLEQLAGYAERVPMLVLATARPELFDRAPRFGQASRNSTRLKLAPLTDTQTARLIDNLLEETVLPAAVQTAILARSGGNPLYAEQFTRLLKDRGILTRHGPTWTVDPGADIPIPYSVHAMIAARLDMLPPERKHLLQDAAVVGKVFWSGALSEMGERDPTEVAGALDDLSRRELIRPARRSSMQGHSEYAFSHDLVRDVCYAQIPRATRGERHRLAAAWIEEVAAERIEDLTEILASHYATALDLAVASRDPDTAELSDQAVRFLVAAGDRALGLDTARARANYARALELVPPGQAQRPEVLARWGEAVLQAGRYADAIDALEEAVSLFKGQGNPFKAARCMTTLANVLWRTGDPRCREVAAEAVALLEPERGPDLVAAYSETARLENLSGNQPEGIEWAHRAIALARELGMEEPAKALGYVGVARAWPGDAAGIADIRRALSMALERGQGWEAATLYNNLSMCLWPIEGPAAALAIVREGDDLCQRRGLDSIAATGASHLFALGSWRELMEAAEGLAKGFEAEGNVLELAFMRSYKARLMALQGGADEALPIAEWAAQAVRGSDAPSYIAGTLANAALVYHSAGQPDNARAVLLELVELPNAAAPNYADSLREMVSTAVAIDDLALAKRLLHRVEYNYPLAEHARCASRAVLAEATGDVAEAAILYAEAAGRWERFGVLPEQAFALLGQGRCLLALGRGSEAIEPIRRAREVFAALDARPRLGESDTLLAQAMELTS